MTEVNVLPCEKEVITIMVISKQILISPAIGVYDLNRPWEMYIL